MKISTKGRYALSLVLDIALQPSNAPVTLKDISKRQSISLKYLEQIIPSLTTAGIIRSVRGPKGGYYLNKDANQISVGSILRLTEGSLAPVDWVVPDSNEPEVKDPITVLVWDKLYQAICDVVDNVTIQDLKNQTLYNGGEYYI